MKCPRCSMEIGNAGVCPGCGASLGAYQQQMNDYNKQMAEYNRQMEEYKRKMEAYNNAQARVNQSVPNQMAPNQMGQMPGQMRQVPGQMGQVPGQMGQMPGQMGQAPGQMRQAPGQMGQAPRPLGSAPVPLGKSTEPVKLTAAPKKKMSTGMIALITSISAIAVIGLIVLLVIAIKPKDGRNSTNGTTETTSEYVNNTTGTTTEEVSTEPATNPYDESYADYTVLFYMIGSNLESGDSYINYGINIGDGGNATLDLDQIADAKIGDNVNVILETGGTGYWQNDYGMEGDHVQRFSVENGRYVEQQDLGKMCMCHEEALEDFLVWGKNNYPANHYILVYWDHGCGLTTASFGSDTSVNEDDVLEAHDMATAMTNSGMHFDLTVFNACLMGTVEMATEISNTSDYMVASEEVIYCFGYYYTNWLTELSENPSISMPELGKIIVDDFAKQYEYYNSKYSTSGTDDFIYELGVIDTKKAVEVKKALSNMFVNADAEIYNLKLTDFLDARSNCGDFSGTHTADIVEFADNYGVEGYKEVVSAVNNCLVYKKATIPYANGLSFYIPMGTEEGCKGYSVMGRVNLTTMNYDAATIKFYDDALSAYAGYNFPDQVADLGMTYYYNQEVVDAYNSTYVDYDKKTDFNMDYTYENGKYVLDLGADFQYVNFMEQRVGYDYIENKAVVLGSDFNVVKYGNGKIDVTFPKTWLSIDGQIVCYVITSHNTNTDGSVTMTGVVPFVLGGDTTRLYGLLVDWDSNTGVSLKGYTEIDMDTLTFVDNYAYTLYEGMEIEFCYGVVEHDGNQLKEDTTSFVKMGDKHTYGASGFSIGYDDIDNFRPLLGSYANTAKGYSYMKVYDVFGNEYTTDLVPEE